MTSIAYRLFAGLGFSFGGFGDEPEFITGEDEEIEDLEDTSCIDHEKCDEPVALIIASRFPECQTFP